MSLGTYVFFLYLIESSKEIDTDNPYIQVPGSHSQENLCCGSSSQVVFREQFFLTPLAQLRLILSV